MKLSRRPLLALLSLLLIVLAAVAVARAADPPSGTVSKASPTVSWTGTVVSAGVTYNAWAQDDGFQCNAPACDRFTLTVVDGGLSLVIRLKGFAENTAGGDPGCSVRIVMPDGSNQHTQGTCGPKTEMRVTVRAAPAGEYQVDIANSHVVNPTGPEGYEASATLGTGSAAPAPAPPVAPGPTPAPAAPAPTLSVKAPSLSARKVKKARRFTATLSTNGRLSNVRALFVDKKRKLGSGSLASLQGTAKITVKVARKARLRPGRTYQLSVGGTDAQGRSVNAAARVRVKR